MIDLRQSAISLRDLFMLTMGGAIVLLLRMTTPEAKAAVAPETGLTCGDWVMQTDQQRPAGDFDAFILNVRTGELLRTRSAGKEVFSVVKK